MQRESKIKAEKREEKYCRAVARQVDTALKRQQKTAAAQSRRRAKNCKKLEAKRQKAEAKRMRARRKTARKRAWNVKRNRPVSAPPCGAPPAYLSRMLQRVPGREAASPGQVLSPAGRADFIRAFWLTALLLLCPLLAVWGMGEAYTAVRANGFADFTTPLSLPDTAGGGFRAFDFVLGADGAPLPVRIFLEIVWRLWSPALRLTLQLLHSLPAALQTAAAWLAGLL